MSTFDADAFMNQEYNTTTDTKIEPIPIGDYLGQIEKVRAKQVTTGGGEVIIIMIITWVILDEGVKKELGNNKPMANQDIFLDTTPEGAIDMGKGHNTQLGLVREAVNQNKDGKPWILSQLVGATAMIKIGHRPDRGNPEIIYSDVKRVTKA